MGIKLKPGQPLHSLELLGRCLDVRHSFSSGCLYDAKGRGQVFRAQSGGLEYWNTPLNDNAKLLYLFMKQLKNEKEQQVFNREQRKSWLQKLSLPKEGVKMHRNVKSLFKKKINEWHIQLQLTQPWFNNHLWSDKGMVLKYKKHFTFTCWALMHLKHWRGNCQRNSISVPPTLTWIKIIM